MVDVLRKDISVHGRQLVQPRSPVVRRSQFCFVILVKSWSEHHGEKRRGLEYPRDLLAVRDL